MEMTCSRCHQTVQDGYCYCPTCGLPQFVYSAENATDAEQPDRWDQAVRGANSVDWIAALRSTLPLAIPAGVLCSLLSPVSVFGLLLMGAAAAWAVVLYTRGQRPSWVTIGAGARIGLVAGVIGGCSAAVVSGFSLFAMRFWLHQGSYFDKFWLDLVDQQQAQGIALGADRQALAAFKAMMISPQGRAGMVLSAVVFLMATLVLFAIAGGALSARLLARTRRS